MCECHARLIRVVHELGRPAGWVDNVQFSVGWIEFGRQCQKYGTLWELY